MVWEMKHTELDTTDLPKFTPRKENGNSWKSLELKKVYDPAYFLIKSGTQKGRRDIDFTEGMDMFPFFVSQTSLETWSSTSEKVLGLFRIQQLETRCHTPEK